MNNFIYPSPNFQQLLLEELKKLNNTLLKIEKKISNNSVKKENNYLEKDDNYYMI